MLTYQQQEASDRIVDWYSTYKLTQKQIFVLAGYAGTGKSFLINYITKNLLQINETQIAYATPTGKAASILIQKGCPATTIHSLIYSPVVNEVKSTINGKEVINKKIDFVKKKSIGSYKLIVLDEVSMINKKIMEDLTSYGIPILACGDLAQLPAIGADSHDLLKNPDYVLTDIVRQEHDSEILKFATMARNGEDLPFGNYNDEVIVIDRDILDRDKLIEYMLTSDQIICGMNSTKNEINKMVRSLKEMKGLVDDGEKLICELNNPQIMFNDDNYMLVNGMSGFVKNFKILDEKLKLATITFKPDFLDDEVNDILIDYSIFEDFEFKYEKHQQIYFMYDGTYRLQHIFSKMTSTENKEAYKKKIREEYLNKKLALATFMLNQFSYGYAISCHKAQGSQWDTVLIFDEHHVFGKDANKWLYTALTRAAKKVIIIK